MPSSIASSGHLADIKVVMLRNTDERFGRQPNNALTYSIIFPAFLTLSCRSEALPASYLR